MVRFSTSTLGIRIPKRRRYYGIICFSTSKRN